MKKKFKSQSEEDIPKFFFFSKLKEIEQQVNDLKKVGIAIDLQHVNRYCDYHNKNSDNTFLDDVVTDEKPKGKRKRFRAFFK